MPIYSNNKFVERILSDNEFQKSVIANEQLIYQLNDISYNDRGLKYKPTKGEITSYAYGKNRYIAPAVNNFDFNDFFQEFRNHWYGWYDDYNLSHKRKMMNGRYVVRYNENKDLELFSKWGQKKFSWEAKWSEGGGSSWTSYAGRNYNDFKYSAGSVYWTGFSIANAMPNCTTYVIGRMRDAGCADPVTSVPDASLWPRVVNTAAGWSCVPYYDGIELSPGDILQWTSGNHVAVVEEVGDNIIVTGSFYTGEHGQSTYGGEYDTRNSFTSLQQLSDWMITNGYGYRLWHSTTMQGESFSVKQSAPDNVLKNPGGGGGEIVHTETGDCADQNNPSFPTDHDYFEKIAFTYYREFNYESSGYGNWSNWSLTSRGSTWDENW